MLQIKNLHASVEDKEILKGINLEIKAGEVHAIMGPNGAGKSTLSSIIAGNENYEVSQGEIFLDGEEISELAAEERAHKGLRISSKRQLTKVERPTEKRKCQQTKC